MKVAVQSKMTFTGTINLYRKVTKYIFRLYHLVQENKKNECQKIVKCTHERLGFSLQIAALNF